MSALQKAVSHISLRQHAILSLLSRGPLTRNVGLVATGHAAAYALTLLAMPLLSRLYAPADFGLLSCYAALMSLIGTGICLRYDAAIPLPTSPRAARALAWLAASVAIVGALCWGVAFVVTRYALKNYALVEELAPYTILLAINLFIFGCSQILTFSATRAGRFACLAQQRLLFVVSLIIAQVAAAWVLPTGNGLIVGQIVAYGVTVSVIGWLLRDVLASPPSTRQMRRVAKTYRRQPQYGLLAESLHVGQAAVPPILLAALFDNAAAGWFLLAWRILGAPVTVMVVPIARVYYLAASRLHRVGHHELEQFFLRTLKKSALIATPGIVAIAAAAPILVPRLLGDDWQPTGRYCQLLCPMLLCHLFAVSVRPTFDVTGRQDLQLIASAIGITFTLIGILAPCVMNLGATAAIAGMSAGGCAAYCVAILLAWWSIRATRRVR